MSAASDITRRAKSNLAFALNILPKARRDDMVVFYAFCRSMDDLADAPGLPLEQRQVALDAWKTGLRDGFAAPDEFQQSVLGLRERHQLPTPLLLAIIDGCLMDLLPQRFQTWNDLTKYIWQVAGAVGLVSIRLFGCTEPASEHYAVTLGQALQLTNILRDINEDLANDSRLYLPCEDLARFDYTEADLLGRVCDERFLALMAYETERADGLFREAAACLPAADRTALLPARIMAEIYQALLHQMRDGGFRVFDTRYRVSTARKLAIFSKHLLG
ncbi:MAG: squalene synthase HpnD [Verrucomicrobia bacterium]|nr:MAG: squalene synthase HpnD [Verrucomicrobiota bacterium]